MIPGKLCKGNNMYLAMMMMDVSEMGCRVAIKAEDNNALPEVKIGDQVKFRFILPGIDGKFEFSGEVKNLQKDNQRSLFGINYLEIKDEVKQTLNNYISFMVDIDMVE